MKICNQNVNLNYYVTFYTVAKLGSFTSAANELNISQPALSFAIKELEQQLGVMLFYRNKKGVALTKIGDDILKFVDNALNNFSIIDDTITNYRDYEIGTVSIGCPAHIHNTFLFNYLKKFLEKYPKVKITLKTGDVNTLIRDLENHEIDFVLDEYPNNCKYNNIKVVNVKKFKKGFIYRKKYFGELNNKCFDLKLLENYKLILPLKENSYRKELDDLLFNNNVKCNNFIETKNTSQMYKYVDNGIGLGYIITNLIEGNSDYAIINLNLNYHLDLMYIDGFTTIMSQKLINYILENKDANY